MKQIEEQRKRQFVRLAKAYGVDALQLEAQFDDIGGTALEQHRRHGCTSGHAWKLAVNIVESRTSTHSVHLTSEIKPIVIENQTYTASSSGALVCLISSLQAQEGPICINCCHCMKTNLELTIACWVD